MSHRTLLSFGGVGTSILAASALFSLAACGSPQGDNTAPADTGAPAAENGPPPPPEMGLPVEPKKTQAASGDPIRKPGGAEDVCQERVRKETGAKVTGVNRIEQSEAAVQIFVNVEGAEEPWVCYANKDGSIWQVEYSGSEGAA